jgi:hypothetical protein
MFQRYENTTTLVARSHLPAGQLIFTLRKAVLAMDPTMPLFDVGTLEDHLALPLTPARLAWLSGCRTRGDWSLWSNGVLRGSESARDRNPDRNWGDTARRACVVTRRSAVLLGTGTLCGVVAALAVRRFFNAVLYGISSKDPVTYVLAITLMTFLASTIPVQRALAVDPASALREE